MGRFEEGARGSRAQKYGHAYRRYERAVRNLQRIRAGSKDSADPVEYRAAEERVAREQERLDALVVRLEVDL